MRWLSALIIAALVVALYIALIWAFLEFVWPVLPAWMAMIFFIALAVFAIGSPIWWLARWSDRALPGARRARKDGGD